MERYAVAFWVKPGSEPAVAEILSSYPSVEVDAGGGARLLGTTVFMKHNLVVRVIDVEGALPLIMRHLSANPTIRAVEEALNPYLVESRDLGSVEGTTRFFGQALMRLITMRQAGEVSSATSQAESIPAHPPVVAFLGLGAMGAAMATRLQASGHQVRAWDQSPDRTALLAQAGTLIGETPGQAVAGVDTVLVCTADDGDLLDAAAGPDGALAAMQPGAILVALGAPAPDTVRRLAAAAGERGIEVLDAGLIGDPGRAADGQLQIYVGGSAAAFGQLRPLLDRLATSVVRAGETGSGTALRLCLNLVLGQQLQAVAEATVLGSRLGVDRGLLLRSIATGGVGSSEIRLRADRMAAGRYERSNQRLAQLLTELDLGLAEAATAGATLPGAAAARNTFAAAAAAGEGDLDSAAILREVERHSRPLGSAAATPQLSS